MFAFLKFAPAAPSGDVTTAIALAAEGKALVIDVREADELRATGRAKGAHHVALSQMPRAGDPSSGHFDKRLAAAQKSGEPVYLYCASGARSGRAADMLRGFGFADVRNLGGFGNLQAAGCKVQR